MPEQAILDLPLVEFERFEGSVDAVSQHCIDVYGITGLSPHADAVFHLTASLFRYRDTESVFQLTALCCFFLRTLSNALAAQRRIVALGAAARDGTGLTKAAYSEAQAEHTHEKANAANLCRMLLAVAGRHFVQSRRNRSAASSRLGQNLALIANASFQEELGSLIGPLSHADFSDLQFDLDPPQVFAQLDQHKARLTKPQNGHSKPSGRFSAVADEAVIEATSSLRGLGALKGELEEARHELQDAAEELVNLRRERAELEEMLRESERMASERALALEELRAALELSVSDARERLARVEREQSGELEQARRKAAESSIEREKLAAELARLTREIESLHKVKDESGREMTRVLERAALSENEREDLLSQIESFDSERDVAAKTIEVLKDKVAQSKDTIARRDEALNELQETVDSLRDELVSSETRLANAQASVLALETESEQLRREAVQGQHSGKALTDHQSRLKQAERRLADSERRVSQLEASLAESKDQLAQTEGKLKDQRRNVEVVSGQLAEAETLSNERADKLERLQSELAEARRGLGESQARLSESSARLKSVASTGKDAEQEMTRIRGQLEDQRRQVARLEETVKARDAEISRRAESEAAQGSRAANAESELAQLRRDLDRQNIELGSRAGESEKDSQETRQKLVTAELRLMEAQQKLDSAEEDLRATNERGADMRQKQDAEIALLRERLTHAEAERQVLTQSLARGEDSQGKERSALEKQVKLLEEQARAQERESEKARAEQEKTRRKLDETDAFLIARQRELERVLTRQKYLISEIKAIAELRTRMEQATTDDARSEPASEVARRLDNLFSEAGAPINADRRTEKIVVMHLKKSDGEIRSETSPEFVATGSGAQEPRTAPEITDAKPPRGKRTTKRSKKPRSKDGAPDSEEESK